MSPWTGGIDGMHEFMQTQNIRLGMPGHIGRVGSEWDSHDANPGSGVVTFTLAGCYVTGVHSMVSAVRPRNRKVGFKLAQQLLRTLGPDPWVLTA